MERQEIIERISKIKWFYFHKRVRSPMYTHLLFKGASQHLNSSLDFPYEVDVFYLDGNVAFPEEGWAYTRSLVNKELKNNTEFLIKLLNDSYELNKDIESLSKKLETLNYEHTSRQSLLKYWLEYVEKMYQFGSYVLLPLFVEQDMENKLRDSISSKFKQSEAEEVFQILTTPMKPGITQQEEENLINLALLKQKGEDINRGIEKHVRKFAWIKNNRLDGSFYSYKEIEKRVLAVIAEDPEKRRSEYLDKIDEAKTDFVAYRDRFKDEKDTTSLIDTLQESIYFRSWRTERYYRNAYFLKPFFKKTSELLGTESPTDIFYLTVDEIVKLLENEEKADMQKIDERKNGYVCFSETESTSIISGKIRQGLQKYMFGEKIELDQDIRGQQTYNGVVSGEVKVVTSLSDLGKIKKGDILVTDSTTPNFVPALKKVKAIVADEGGVLSHASVISRELHIPCIIGTKIATQVLKDGDMVEVDADRGVVRKLQKDKQIES